MLAFRLMAGLTLGFCVVGPILDDKKKDWPPHPTIPVVNPKWPEWPLPPVVKPQPRPTFDPIDVLPKGKLYVVQHNGDPVQLLCSPQDVVAIKEYKGKVVIDGYFVDGTEEETREYEAKQVFLVKRLLPGQFELLKVPAGKVERRLLTDIVPKPIPPKPDPDPAPEPKPKPTEPVIAIDGVSVLLLYETADLAKMTKEQATIPYSTRLYTYLDSVCAMHPNGKVKAWAIWDKDLDGYLDSKAFGDAQARKRDLIPWAIISSRNGSYEGPWPKDDLALIDLINRTIGKK